MRRFWCVASIVLAIPSFEARGQAQSGARFAPDAIELLEQITQGYELNGKRMPAGNFDAGTLARLEGSSDPRVRELARLLPDLKLFKSLSTQGGKAAGRAIVDQANQMPANAARRVIEAMASPEEEQNEIRSAAKTLEAMMGSEPQKKVNEAWALACLGNGLAMALKQQLAGLANAGTTGSATPLSVDVTIGTGAGRLGTISVANRSRQALKHCLIITRLVADRDRISRMAAQEDTVGALLLPAMGFTHQTVQGSREAARLRYLFFQQDHGVVVYVPEVPSGGTVTTTLAPPSHYAVAKDAEISLWSDEGAVEHRSASNWASVSRPAAARTARGGRPVLAPGRRPAMNTPARKSTPAARTTNRRAGSSSPFAVGSVWKGTSRVGPSKGKKVTQQIVFTITERDGDNFKGRLLYNGRNPATIEGTISGESVDWQIRGRGQLGLPHSGRVTGTRMDVTYSGPGSDDTIEGTMVLNHVR